MHSKINYSIKWSLLELRGLVEDEDTRVFFQRSKRHLALHPFQLNDLNKALQEILSSSVNFYDNELQGLVLAYKNPKLLSPLGGILHDSHFIHVDIIADFYIFKPEIGCTLKGIVNKKGANHVGVLVHKAFNVSIPKEEENEEWLGYCVYVGQQVKFTVTHLDFKGKLPFVRGKLLADGITVENDDAQTSSMNADEEDEKLQKWNNSLKNNLESEKSNKHSKNDNVINSSGDELSDSDNKLKVFNKKEKKNTKIGSDSSKKRSKKFNVDNDNDESSDVDVKLKVFRHKETKKDCTESSKKLSKSSNVNTSSGDELSDSVNRLKTSKIKEAKSKKLEVASPKKRSKKSNVIDRSGEDFSDSDDKLKVFKAKEERSRKVEKSEASTSRNDDSDADDSDERRSKNVSIEKQEETSNKRDRKKLRDSSNKKLNTEEIEEKSKISPRKASKEQRTNGASHSISDEISVKSEAHGTSRKRSHKNSVSVTSSETEEASESKSGLIKSMKVEKSSKDKNESLKSNTSMNGSRLDSDEDPDDNVVLPKKRQKKNHINDSEGEDASEIDTKPDMLIKKKKKKTKIKTDGEEIVNSTLNESNIHTSYDSSFEFVKPELDACLSSTKIKRKRRKDIKANGEEESDSSKTNLAENNSDECNFFNDIRIKAEPDPSDAEDAVSRSIKRKKKHAKKEVESSDERDYQNARIKIEPNASDVEDTMPSKKKSKRRKTSEGESFMNVKIKIEPNASDVEDSVNPKRKFKTEPHDSKPKVDRCSDRV